MKRGDTIIVDGQPCTITAHTSTTGRWWSKGEIARRDAIHLVTGFLVGLIPSGMVVAHLVWGWF